MTETKQRRGKLRPADHPDPLRAIERVPTEVLFASRPDGIMDERQVEAVLLGFFFRASRMRDRRGSAVAVGEQPKTAMVYDEEQKRWVSEAGAPILSSGPINKATGLPESSSALLPKHRALYGWDLALSMIVPPEDLMASCVYTDDLPDLPNNQQLPPEQREWRSLALKTKYKMGPHGRPLSRYHCNGCDEEWEQEESPFDAGCRRCGKRGLIPGMRRAWVEHVTIDAWGDDEVLCVKENTRRLKTVLRRLGQRGLFNLKPKIDEKEAELGTTVLHDPGDEDEVLGFKITSAGLAYAEEWARVHPEFANGHTILESMGPTLAKLAPQWVQAENRSKVPVEDIRQWF